MIDRKLDLVQVLVIDYYSILVCKRKSRREDEGGSHIPVWNEGNRYERKERSHCISSEFHK